MVFGGPEPQARNFEQVGKHRESLRTRGVKATLWACPDYRVPQFIFKTEDFVLLLIRKIFGSFQQGVIVWHAIEVDAGLDIVSKFVLEGASNLALKYGETIVCCASSICLLDNELSALIEPLQGARNCECQEQADQSKHGALDGGEARHGASIFVHISQAELSPVVQQ